MAKKKKETFCLRLKLLKSPERFDTKIKVSKLKTYNDSDIERMMNKKLDIEIDNRKVIYG